VEALQEVLGGLLHERERLRLAGSSREELERNRRAIVGVHQALARAMIALRTA
jgi:hypothetical protein